ncbi:MAG: ABC transporter permease [Bacteroidetes bacterium]|nr:ABC transporter permease [Bacteroidota bacterium]
MSHQLENRLEAHAGKVDLVVGAKGSPMQLILSSIYHADFPTGNIKLGDAMALVKHPYVKQAVPISIGDSYNGYRVIGTDEGFLSLYDLSLKKGNLFKEEFEAVVGAEAARDLNLTIGSNFYSAHGLTEGAVAHHGHPFVVVGILGHSGTVADQLILTGLETIWHVHGLEEEEIEKDITSLLIKYSTPLAIAIFPSIVNQIPNLQAASPALETARLFSLLSSGFDIIKAFGILIILLAAFSVFMVLYASLAERKMDIALIRSMGAGRIKVFAMMVLEGLIISISGIMIGIVVSHILIETSAVFLPAQQATALSGYVFIADELYVLGLGIATGFIASIIPAISAYKTDISAVLSKR